MSARDDLKRPGHADRCERCARAGTQLPRAGQPKAVHGATAVSCATVQATAERRRFVRRYPVDGCPVRPVIPQGRELPGAATRFACAELDREAGDTATPVRAVLLRRLPPAVVDAKTTTPARSRADGECHVR